ncbi:MAG: hypothetical protein ABS889_03790 [Desemzia incerta]
MKKSTLSKNIKEIKSSASYDVKFIVNEIKKHYHDNDFSNEILLKRLQQLRVEKLYMDSFQGGIVGLLIGALAVDTSSSSSVIEQIQSTFATNKAAGIMMVIMLLIIFIIFAGIVLATLHFIKFLYYKMVKSAVLGDYIDEKETEIIMQILDDKLNE